MRRTTSNPSTPSTLRGARRLIVLALFALPLLIGGPATAQPGLGTNEPVSLVGAVVEPASVQAGKDVALTVTLAIDEHWHIYSTRPAGDAAIPTELRIDSTSIPLEENGSWREGREPVIFQNERTHEGPEIGFYLSLIVPRDAADGLADGEELEVTIEGTVGWQSCDDNICNMPAEAQFTATFTVSKPASIFGDGNGDGDAGHGDGDTADTETDADAGDGDQGEAAAELPRGPHDGWYFELEEALAWERRRGINAPVLVAFVDHDDEVAAENDELYLGDDAVQEKLADFVLVKMWTNAGENLPSEGSLERIQEVRQRLTGATSSPVYVVVDANARPIVEPIEGDIYDIGGEDFLVEWLDRALAVERPDTLEEPVEELPAFEGLHHSWMEENADPVHVASAVIEPAVVEPGKDVTLTVTVAIDWPWHIYSLHAQGDAAIPTTLVIQESTIPLEENGSWRELQEPHPHQDILIHEWPDVTFQLSLIVPRDAAGALAAGEELTVTVKGIVDYQTCVDVCHMPTDRPWTASFKVVKPAAVDTGNMEAVVNLLLERLDEIATRDATRAAALREELQALAQNMQLLFNSQQEQLDRIQQQVLEIIIDEGEPRIDEPVTPPDDDGTEDPPIVPVDQTQDTPPENGAGGGGSLDDLNNADFWTFIGLMIAGALVSLLTPCVFPMIPVTISFFTKQAEIRKKAIDDATAAGDDPGKLAKLPKPQSPLKLATIYALGIIISLSTVGMLLSAIVGRAEIGEELASNPWINLFLAVVLIAMALSFFGLFELKIPDPIMNFLGRITRRPGSTGTGVIETASTGAIFTLASFACTGPILAAIMSLALASGQWFYAAVGMLVYSIVFAAPFFVMALFPGLLTKLPRAGSWMNRIKVVMGFLEVAAALKFLQMADIAFNLQILTRPAMLGGWAAITVIMGVYILGKLPLKDDEPVQRTGPIAVMMGLGFIGFGLYLLSGMSGAKVWDFVDTYVTGTGAYDVHALQRADERADLLIEIEDRLAAYSGGGPVGDGSSVGRPPQGPHLTAEGRWFFDLEKALAAQREAGTNFPVFIDITGHNCQNCRYNEGKYFRDGAIARKMRKFVRVQIWTDAGPNTPDAAAVTRAHKLRSLLTGLASRPIYVIVDVNGNPVVEHVEGVIDNHGGRDFFLDWLDRGLAAARPSVVKPMNELSLFN